MVTDIGCWQAPPQNPTLTANSLDLWRISLKASPATLSHLKKTLSSDERTRADRLIDRNKADSFIVARGLLRQVLGSYLQIPPAAVRFSYGEKGKPALCESHGSDLRFNLSHAGDWALLALAGRDVGVDLEQIDPHIDRQKIASRFFDANEKAILENYPPSRRTRGFYRVWTRKEARLKMTGFGFSAAPATEYFNKEEWTRLFPITKNTLGAIAALGKFDSIHRYQIVETSI